MDRGHNQPPELVEMLRSTLVEAASEPDDDATLHELIEQVMGTISDVVTNDATCEDLNAKAKKIVDIGNRWHRERPQIKSDEEHEKGTAFIAAAQTLEGRIETARKSRGTPVFQAKKGIDSHFNTLKNKVTLVRGDVQRKANDFVAQKKREAEARAAEEKRKADEAMRAAQEQARKAEQENDEAAKQKAQEAVMEAQKTEKAAATAGKVGGKTDQGVDYHTRTVDVITVDDKSKIPLKIWQDYTDQEMVDKIIRAARRDGIKDIPGVTVTQEVRQITRS